MNLIDTLKDDLKSAMRAKDEPTLRTLRMLFASIKNFEIEARKKEGDVGDEEILTLIQKEAKKRRDAIEEFEKADRGDRASGEKEELEILSRYLPEELSDDEIRRVVEGGVRELGDEKNLGALMKIIMPTLKGKASGDRISHIAKEVLDS